MVVNLQGLDKNGSKHTGSCTRMYNKILMESASKQERTWNIWEGRDMEAICLNDHNFFGTK